MEKIIRGMVEYADKTQNYEVAEFVGDILDKMGETFNCPSNWSDLGEKFAQEYNGNDWVMNNCRLNDYMW